jgi:cell fate (sporulation/competence/biofilm development) regulator YlbF (YheA/YmcA/DUF963 family)
MRNEKRICFKQSTTDFPLSVSLNSKIPEWGLNRWKTNKGLRFVPPDDEGFTLRGDKQRLVYKGRRRSHRFTILGDMAFEYDCILEREPESNVISLRMEGAENFDFFRQPNYVEEPFLKGSYAVYKKDTLVGEGTGKLCHIHRPEVIDARGRRCWGELSVVGNELRIIIPEQWLAEAKYPVIVDPTIGTTTVGSQYQFRQNNINIQLYFDGLIPVNRFLVPQSFEGLCIASMYINANGHLPTAGHPVLYSDNNDTPQTKKSINEYMSDFTFTKNNPSAGWRQSSFYTSEVIQSGLYIWFGVFTYLYWEPRFDYGGKCYTDFYNFSLTSAPNTYPIYNVNIYKDYLLSMYFTCTAAAQNFVRTLTQGVSLPDNRIVEGDYKRITSQIVQADATHTKRLDIFKTIQDTLNSYDLAKKLLSIFARIQDTLSTISLTTKMLSGLRKIRDTANGFDLTYKMLTIFASIKDTVNNFDISKSSFLHFRQIKETIKTSDTISHLRDLVRGLVDIAGTESEGKTAWLHFRTIRENAMLVSSISRGLFLFVRIVSGVFIRDHLLGRFLKSKAELALKSCVTREITLESKIN